MAYIKSFVQVNRKIQDGKLVSIKKYIGDELHFNYNENETNMAAPFKIGDMDICKMSNTNK